ncbi:hypothetical protein PM082_019404 [Marasmius tenuissimus]|nr:hypothetical protein PM082_019404 [Marasmius tenuissimus]
MSVESLSYQGSGVLVPLFITIHTFVWIGSSLILLTAALSPNIRRHPTFVSQKLSWILACFSYALLFTTGQLYKLEPTFWICLVQAAAVYSVPILTTGTSLSLAIYLYLVVKGKEGKGGKIRTVALICVPYILPSTAFFSVLSMGQADRSSVGFSSNRMVCGMRGLGVLGLTSDVCVAIILVPSIIIQSLTIISVYEHRYSYGNTILPTLIRLSVFTTFGVFGTIIRFWSSRLTSPHETALGNVLTSILPLSYILLFGLQKDIVEAWAFWRRKPSISGFAEKDGGARKEDIRSTV